MRRVRRLIRRTKWVRTKYQNVETQDPFEPPFQTDYSNLPYIQVNDVNKPPVKLEQAPIEVEQAPIEVEKAHRKPVTDFVSLAIKAAKALNKKTSLAHIDNVAEGLFKFDMDPHLHITMPDIVSQEIVNWIITLSKQPILPDEKLRLAKKFIVSLAPVNSSVEEQENLPLVWPR